MGKIFIICPPKTATGGTEALHQLCDALTKLGKDASIVYVPNFGIQELTPRQFSDYDIYVSDAIEDIEDNAVVIPEIWCELINHIHYAKVYLWWLSVDNAHITSGIHRDDVTHLAQSEYARQYLADTLKLNNVEWLSDYINDAYFSIDTAVKREDVVLFNPKKGFENTAQLIMASNGTIKWQAINDMTSYEIVEAMDSAKMYIDFGNCPGKDRLPREAILRGCVIFTSTKGGFGNDIDIPIPKTHKFDTMDNVLNKIYECMQSDLGFEMRKKQMDAYQQICDEKERFLEDVGRVFKEY